MVAVRPVGQPWPDEEAVPVHRTLRPARALAALPSLLLGASLAACAGRPAPTTSPTPVVVVQATPAARGTAADTDDARATTASGGRSRPDSAAITRQDITREAVNVFGDSVASDSSDEQVIGEGDAEAVSWDIDVRSFETHARVEHYVRYFSGSARDRIQDRLGRGSRYEPMIRAKFRAAGIPEDMYYLALIESGYDNHAYSRAAAVGMWQFMSSTAKDLGMRVDWWIDERRDPVKATEGATRFLRWLNEQLGSFYLAAAAYNGGPGRVARGLTRFAADMEGETGDEQFFSLAEKDYLPRETKEYVPQLIAAALVGKNPAHYGLTLTTREPFTYDSVRAGPTLPLAAAARAAGVTTAEILELNPHVLRGVTPPKTTMWLRVPTGHAIGFDSALATLDEDELKAFRRVESKKGQTAASLARSYGLTEKQLRWYNQKLERKKNGTLYPGQVVLIPSLAVAAAARDIPDPSVERYGSSKAGATKYYVVKRGDNLGVIARRNGTTVANLKRLNRLKKDIVLPGQTLLVKGSAPRASGSRVAKGTSKSKKPTVASRPKSSLPSLSTKAKSPTAKKTPPKKAPAKKSTAKR
jgi:membrane-bound lytic murein transglycosylase D